MACGGTEMAGKTDNFSFQPLRRAVDVFGIGFAYLNMNFQRSNIRRKSEKWKQLKIGDNDYDADEKKSKLVAKYLQ